MNYTQIISPALLAISMQGSLLASESSESSIKVGPSTCSFGLVGFCLVEGNARSTDSSTWRFESFGGYKLSMSYFEDEQASCKDTASCSLDVDGAVYGLDAFYNYEGNNYSDDYTDYGIQYASLPIASWNSEQSFAGTSGSTLQAGKGSLRYHFVRLAVKRSHFLYMIRSQYLISSFGVGVAIAQADGVADDWIATKSFAPTIGGKLGFQYPILKNLDIGIATNWSVLWYGDRFSDSAFISGYGINLSYRS